jgi:hypothetical protein
MGPTKAEVLTYYPPFRCLGRSFAVTNMKAVLAVLLRKFSFELLEGPDTEIEERRTIVHRPKEVSMDGPIVRMRVKLIQ